MIEQTR
jgi:DNA polymerase delta subunit 1